MAGTEGPPGPVRAVLGLFQEVHLQEGPERGAVPGPGQLHVESVERPCSFATGAAKGAGWVQQCTEFCVNAVAAAGGRPLLFARYIDQP